MRPELIVKTDEKTYYKDHEPWKHEPKHPSAFKQTMVILLVLVVCAVIVHVGLSFHPYDWSEFGFLKVIRRILEDKNMWGVK